MKPLLLNLVDMSAHAKRWAKAHLALPKGVFYLHGDMGAGKTTWVRQVLMSMGVDEAVTSPTFGLVHRYYVGSLCLVHADLFRFETIEQLHEMGLWDEIEQADLAWIEWPERAKGYLPSADVSLHFAWQSEHLRQFWWQEHTQLGSDLTLSLR